MAVRVFAKRREGRRPSSEEDAHPPIRRRYPHEAVLFRSETDRTPAQRLLFGVWRFYRDPHGAKPGSTCVEEGLFYPDDLPEWDPSGFAKLRAFAMGHAQDAAPGFSRMRSGRELLLWPLSKWLEERLFRYGYSHRNRCDIVAFNLPFDLGRVASHWGPATGFHRGGFSLGIWGHFGPRGGWHDRKFHPRIRVKAIDPRRTLIGFGLLKTKDRDKWGKMPGRFVDLHTLAFALTDRNLTLELACEAFGDPFEKKSVTYGVVSKKLMAYAREDVRHTSTLYRNCLRELRRHQGIDLQAPRLFSPATVGTKYLEAMGVERPKKKFAMLDRQIHGWAMSAFFGGRAEARIVRTPVPISLVDATSMYPTVNALLGTWKVVSAARVKAREVTDDVRELLASPDLLSRCLSREFWRGKIGVTLVEIDHPDGVVLPVRAYYDPEGVDPGIGVNPLTYEGSLWYMLPDVIAAAILSHAPHIKRAIRLDPDRTQRGLHPVRFRGARSIDPMKQDPFVAMIEERSRVSADASLSDEERGRLDLFLKITANATSYGVLARFDRKEFEDPKSVEVFGPDEEATSAKTNHPEDPGPYCFPPVAASLTSGARLMLAMLERLLTEAGGSYAFCDTDSMGIVAARKSRQVPCITPDGSGSVRALSTEEVRGILGRFDDLNPYDRGLVPELWKFEHDSLEDPLWCYAISAKRYALYRLEADGAPSLVTSVDAHEEAAEAEELSEDQGLADWSEHGLGLYLDPIDPDRPQRDERKRRIWMRQAWDWVLSPEGTALPEWASTYALTRFTVSSPRVQRWFAGHDVAVPKAERVRPGTFGLLAHPTGIVAPVSADALPAATYESDPRRWPELPWFDRSTGKRVEVHTLTPGANPEGFADAVERGAVRIDTLGEVLMGYGLRPEHKSLASDGSPTGQGTAGLLRRRPVAGGPVLTDLVGKEGNRLIERLSGEVTDPDEYRTGYGNREDRWKVLVVPVLRKMGAAEVAARAGMSRRAIERAIRKENPTIPHRSSRAEYVRVAADWVAQRMRRGVHPSRSGLGALYCYWQDSGLSEAVQVCACGCGEPLPPRHRKWISDSHRKRAARGAKQDSETVLNVSRSHEP